MTPLSLSQQRKQPVTNVKLYPAWQNSFPDKQGSGVVRFSRRVRVRERVRVRSAGSYSYSYSPYRPSQARSPSPNHPAKEGTDTAPGRVAGGCANTSLRLQSGEIRA